MSLFSNNYGRWALTVLYGIGAFLFWYVAYPYVLSYQEQFQLFLFDGDYFVNRLNEPGGMARYLGEFLVQFYNNFLAGAIIIALLLVMIQRLTWRLIKRKESWNSIFLYLLSFIPSVLVWLMMGDVNVLLGFVVAVIMVLASMLLSGKLNIWWNLLLILITYWMAGPLVIVHAIFVAVRVLMEKHYLLSPLPVLCVVLAVWVSSVVLPYTLPVLWCGLGYYRIFATIPMPGGFNARTYELIEYDYLVRTRNWNGIIAKAEQKTPDLPMSVCATNLALAMNNQLGERVFDYYQHGPEGLFPRFDRNFNTTLVTSEAYFHLGLVNTAQRLAFETMEAIPNHQKSARCIRRLAETNLINGQYDVARKYLKLLEKTLFYRKWAQETMALLGQENLINEHPLYGYLRKVRLSEDFLFSEQEVDKICGRLVMKNKNNRMALQYLLVYPLLNRDINTFMNYMMYVSGKVHYNPRACQEAVVYAYASQKQRLPQGLVSPQVMQRFDGFMQALQSHGSLDMYRNTVWYYLAKGEK